VSIDERVLAVIQVLYDAALDETIWPKALQDLVDLTRSQGATFWTLESSKQPRLPIFRTFNFDDRFVRDYLESMVPLDPTVQYLVHHPEEPIVHDGIVISERDKEFHPYYDWQSRESDIHFRMVGQTRPTPTVQAGVALHRTRKVGRYEPEDLERFALIHGHLKRALAIGIRLGSLNAREQCTTALLDRNPAAILLLDQHKCIVYANRSAEALRSSTAGIRLSRNGIV
jgi:PAS domain-containing protein